MLVIRLQRTGRKGHAQFRVVVQDSRRTPTSGKVVALLGTYNPHAKQLNIKKDRAVHYMEHGAQPSPRVARLLKEDGVKLPKWVKLPEVKEGKIRNPDKLRRNQPDEPVVEEPETKPADEAEDKLETSQEELQPGSETPEVEEKPAE